MSESKPTLIFNQQTAGGKISVWQQEDRRWLDFDDGLIQSEISLSKPDVLPLPLNRAMLAGMMFVEQPKRVLLAGTGGGATARYFTHRFPEVEGDAIEKSEAVVKIAQDYFEFPTSGNWNILTEDIVNYVFQCQQKYDLIIIDIAEDQKTPEWLVDTNFLKQCRSMLTNSGCLSINLLPNDASNFSRCLSSIRNVFDGQTACLSLPDHRNIVTLAYNTQPSFMPDTLAEELPFLTELWAVEFSEFYRQMLQDNPEGSGVI